MLNFRIIWYLKNKNKMLGYCTFDILQPLWYRRRPLSGQLFVSLCCNCMEEHYVCDKTFGAGLTCCLWASSLIQKFRLKFYMHSSDLHCFIFFSCFFHILTHFMLWPVSHCYLFHSLSVFLLNFLLPLTCTLIHI